MACPYCKGAIEDISGRKDKTRLWCLKCKAQFYKKWYSWKEWDKYINE
jgi:uncharacterized protein YbaR (Trm112 family)